MAFDSPLTTLHTQCSQTAENPHSGGQHAETSPPSRKNSRLPRARLVKPPSGVASAAAGTRLTGQRQPHASVPHLSHVLRRRGAIRSRYVVTLFKKGQKEPRPQSEHVEHASRSHERLLPLQQGNRAIESLHHVHGPQTSTPGTDGIGRHGVVEQPSTEMRSANRSGDSFNYPQQTRPALGTSRTEIPNSVLLKRAESRAGEIYMSRALQNETETKKPAPEEWPLRANNAQSHRWTMPTLKSFSAYEKRDSPGTAKSTPICTPPNSPFSAKNSGNGVLQGEPSRRSSRIPARVTRSHRTPSTIPDNYVSVNACNDSFHTCPQSPSSSSSADDTTTATQEPALPPYPHRSNRARLSYDPIFYGGLATPREDLNDTYDYGALSAWYQRDLSVTNPDPTCTVRYCPCESCAHTRQRRRAACVGLPIRMADVWDACRLLALASDRADAADRHDADLRRRYRGVEAALEALPSVGVAPAVAGPQEEEETMWRVFMREFIALEADVWTAYRGCVEAGELDLEHAERAMGVERGAEALFQEREAVAQMGLE